LMPSQAIFAAAFQDGSMPFPHPTDALPSVIQVAGRQLAVIDEVMVLCTQRSYAHEIPPDFSVFS
jgi:hypothetical protein